MARVLAVCVGGCAALVALAALAVSLYLGTIHSGILVHLGALAWIDDWDPEGRGLRWRGEAPWLVPKPWKFSHEELAQMDLSRCLHEAGRLTERGDCQPPLSWSAGTAAPSSGYFLITGANSGLGYWTAVLLARQGARIVLACRSLSKCEEAVEAIRRDEKVAQHDSARCERQKPAGQAAAGQQLVPVELDLSSFASIRAFADKLNNELRLPLASLILNAGIFPHHPFQLTRDNLELTMGTNHYGHFLLTMLLLPNLVASTRDAAAVATISVHSSAVIFEPSKLPDGVGILFAESPPGSGPIAGSPDHASPDARDGVPAPDAAAAGDGYYYYAGRIAPGSEVFNQSEVWYDQLEAYRQSKLANVLFAQELARRISGDPGLSDRILVNAHAPGSVRTNLLGHIWGTFSRDGPSFSRDGAVPSQVEQIMGSYGRYFYLKYIWPSHKMMWDPEDAALTQVYTAVGQDLKARRLTGRYFQSVARLVDPDPHCNNRTLQALLWRSSEEITGARYPL